MASYTKTTRFKRKIRLKNAGKDRKAQVRANGTTPSFEVHSADAVANAPLAQLSPAQREARES